MRHANITRTMMTRRIIRVDCNEKLVADFSGFTIAIKRLKFNKLEIVFDFKISFFFSQDMTMIQNCLIVCVLKYHVKLNFETHLKGKKGGKSGRKKRTNVSDCNRRLTQVVSVKNIHVAILGYPYES